MEYPLLKSVGQFVTELNKLLAFYLTIACLGICSKGPRIHFHVRIFMWALVTALFIVAQTEKSIKVSSKRRIGEYTIMQPDNGTSLSTKKKQACEPRKDMEKT